MTISNITQSYSTAAFMPMQHEADSRLFIRRETATVGSLVVDNEKRSGSGRELSPAKVPSKKNWKSWRYVARIQDLVENNIDNEHYSITQLCRDACTSRAQLHRHLMAVTGLSASKFIRHIRLEVAKVLLLTTDLYVYQVAYEVGFSDYRYFTRVFSESYQESPKDFRKNKWR